MKTNVKKVENLEDVNVEVEAKKTKATHETVDSFDDIEFDNDGFSTSYDEVYFVKIAGLKRGETAHFKISKKVNDVYVTEERTDRKMLSGEVSKIETGSYTYENKEIKTLKISFVTNKNDVKKLYILNLNYNSLTRTMINSMLSVDEKIEKMTIGLGKNGGGFNTIAVAINGNKGVWKYDMSVFKEKTELIKNKKGEVLSTDYSDLNEFLEDEIYKMLKIWMPNQAVNVVNFIDEEEDEKETELFKDEEDPTQFFEIDDIN